MSIAVYPGTFDPVTYGHLDILRRAAGVFSHVVVATTEAPQKQCLFSLEERLSQLHQAVEGMHNVEVRSFQGMLVDFVRSLGASVVIRGMRETTDFEYEFQMALMNKRIAPEVETVFFVTALDYLYLSSSLVTDIALRGGDISAFVPSFVEDAIMRKLGKG